MGCKCERKKWLEEVHRKKHLQLQTEGDAQHLKSFHLKVYSNSGLVILIKGVFAEPEGAPEVLALSPAHLARSGPTLPSPTQFSSGTLLPINETSLPHRQVPHHNDLGDLKSAGRKRRQEEWALVLSPNLRGLQR